MVIFPEKIGIVYELVAKYRGEVLDEEVQDGTNYIMIDLMIPLVSSFGFIDSIRRACQGIAYPQLVFKGFEINEEDPFFIPATEEELEDIGLGDILPSNATKMMIEKVRKRKGLLIDQKMIVDATKQRTLTKNK